MTACDAHALFRSITGFNKPSAIQQRAIHPITQGRDVIAQAQSGTGKTATIGLTALQIIDTNVRDTQVLVLSPTRCASLCFRWPSGATRFFSPH